MNAAIAGPRRLILIAASLSLLAACQAPANGPASAPTPSASSTAQPSASPSASPVSPATPQDLSLRLQADASLASFATSAAEPFRLCLSQIRAVRHSIELQQPVSVSTKAALEAMGARFTNEDRSFELTRSTSLSDLLKGLVMELKQLPSSSLKIRTLFLGPEALMLGYLDWEADGASLQRSLTLTLKSAAGLVSGEGCPLIASEVQGGRTLSTGGGIFNSPTGHASPSPTGSGPDTSETVKPGLPTELRLVEQSGSSLTLQWDFPTNARSFKLYLDAQEVAANHVTPNYYRYEGLRPSTDYVLGVKAINAAGESEVVTLKARTLAAGGRSASGNFSSGGNGNTSHEPETNTDEMLINQTTSVSQSIPDVAGNIDGNYLLVWQSDTGNSDDLVYGRLFDHSGHALGNEFRIDDSTSQAQSEPRVTTTGTGDFVVVWSSFDGDESVKARVFNSQAQPRTEPLTIETVDLNSRSIAVAANRDRFVAIWQEDSDGNTHARVLDLDGESLSEPFAIDRSTYSQQNPEVAMDADGNFTVVYLQEDSGEKTRLFGRSFDDEIEPIGSSFLINQVTREMRDPAIAMDKDGDFAVVWAGYDENFYPEIYLRRFEADATPASDETQVNTSTSGYQILPDIAFDDDGDFVVSWQDPYLDGDDYAVMLQRYRASGRRSGGEVMVNDVTSGEQTNSALAFDADGHLMVTWMSFGQDGDGESVVARIMP